jgi:asparagine synthase (glutamine-hydrolysing)
MCGIAGYLSKSGANDPTRVGGLLSAMLSELKHRGPDDSGVWHGSKGTAHLLHTRLSILDLSPSGHQPMSTTDGRYTVTFNGEIYNFSALREELQKQGVQFQTRSDTEVLLAMYQAHGTECVKHLRGMFAFCIWDEQEQKAFLARDPMGIKPLYYSHHADGSLVFASELRALRKAGAVPDQLNGQALVAYFETGSVPEPMTLLQNVFMLEAGCWLQWERGGLRKDHYWQMSFANGASDDHDDVAQVREALLDSVRHHFVSDVPVGIFLSGGIDSTVLLALAREAGFSGIQTFSVGVDDLELDESSVARETAAIFGSDHHELRLEGSEAEASFAAFLECGDQPSIDGFNTYTVSRFARRCGMKVVLSGLGGDEIFGGYPSFAAVPKLARLSRLAAAIPPLAAVLGHWVERHGSSPRVRRLGAMLTRPPGVVSAYRTFRGVFSPRVARVLARRFVADLPLDMPDYDPGMPGMPSHEADQVSALELCRYMRNQLLKDSDTMSMAHGLELRVPFVDKALFEAVARVPASRRLRPGKQMLLDAVPEVPAKVAAAKKRGFVFPFEKWLQASWGREFDAVTRSMPSANPTWYQRWCVFVLERWLERV